MMYYQIIKADGSSKNYKIFSEMLDDFDRQDVMDLHRLVQERYDITSPEGYDLLLWGDLKTLFEPNEEDEIWKNQQDYNLISWRLFDSCGVHVLLMNTGVAIHMMIEKKYPLTQEMLSRMLHRRLEVDYESKMAFELLRFTRSQLQKINKARLNFKEVLQHYKSGTQSRRKDLRKRLGHKHIRSISGSPEPRRDRTELPRKKGPKRKTVFKRLEKGGVFHRLREKEKRAESTSKKNNSKRESSRRTKALSEGEDSAGGHWKSRSKRQKSSVKEDDLSQPWAYEEIDPFTPRIRYFDFPKTRMPSHIKTYDGSDDPEDHLEIFQAIAKTEHWAMPTWCHMFISTITRNARVWFDDLPKESIDSYDDLKKAFLENYLQQKKCIKDLVEIHNINQRDGESMEEFVRRRGGGLQSRTEEVIPVVETARSWTEAKLQKGKLPEPTKAKAAKKRETSEKDKPLTILMVQPWQKIAKQRFTQTFSPKAVISFPPLGEEDGTEGSMIIEARMGGHFVHRMYVDGGSSSKILYEHCFNRFRPEVRSQMVFAATPLIAISIQQDHRKAGSKENPGSSVHGSRNAKIPSPGAQQFVIDQAAEEKIQVAIYPVYPKQTIAIGSTLTEEGWKELYGLLRRNLDIFAWRPANMTGVPRHIAEHRLNIREGCLPVRQKKKGQAPERNKAIYEEVEKLVDAGIMKEVHYHSWLSNPVMVKRHDESWRMCVDLKDLNKACPKDGYPLPEIDWNVESLCGNAQRKVTSNGLRKRKRNSSNEKIACGIAYANRTKRERRINHLPSSSKISDQCSPNDGKERETNAHLLRQPRITGPENKLHPNGKTDTSFRRLLKWSFELEEHDIHYRPRTSVKGQILADFIVERLEDNSLDTPMEDKEELSDLWILLTDG
ncbi:reverse transcriptase domain-containing protein [Tanacetum coccineum]